MVHKRKKTFDVWVHAVKLSSEKKPRVYASVEKQNATDHLKAYKGIQKLKTDFVEFNKIKKVKV